MQNISTGEVVAAYNFTSQTNNLVERVKRLELANWRWFPVWSSDRHRQMALASRGHFLLLADRRQMKGAQSDARLRFRKRNDTKAMNEWMCRPHQIPPPSAKKERSVSRSLRPFGTRAKKNKWKKIILETMKKIQSWRSLNCSQQAHLCGQSEKWTLMDVPSSTECATIKWRCKHRTWFA